MPLPTQGHLHLHCVQMERKWNRKMNIIPFSLALCELPYFLLPNFPLLFLQFLLLILSIFVSDFKSLLEQDRNINTHPDIYQ